MDLFNAEWQPLERRRTKLVNCGCSFCLQILILNIRQPSNQMGNRFHIANNLLFVFLMAAFCHYYQSFDNFISGLPEGFQSFEQFLISRVTAHYFLNELNQNNCTFC